MSFNDWWRKKNGKQKTITILATLLVLDIGLCFATPYGLSLIDGIFRRTARDPLEGLGWMFCQAVFCGILVLVIAVMWLVFDHD